MGSRLAARLVIYGDALGNAIIPVITALGVVFGFLMAGNAVVESVFGWPGIGNYAVKALMLKDSGPIQSFVLFVASDVRPGEPSCRSGLQSRGPKDSDQMTLEIARAANADLPAAPDTAFVSFRRRLLRNKPSFVAFCAIVLLVVIAVTSSLDCALRSERAGRERRPATTKLGSRAGN